MAGGVREDRRHARDDGTKAAAERLDAPSQGKPTRTQLRYLRRGLDQPAGKLPLFDEFGAAISPRTIRSCVKQGWAESWISNPIKPDWLVCRLTPQGHKIAEET